MRLIYLAVLLNDFGLPDFGFSYPDTQALYQVSVRRIKCLSTASFRSPVTRDTLACNYRIPVITAPLGLEILYLAPFRFIMCPAHPIWSAYGTHKNNSYPIATDIMPRWGIYSRFNMSH